MHWKHLICPNQGGHGVVCFDQTPLGIVMYGLDLISSGQHYLRKGHPMSATLYVDGLLASLSKPELKGMFSRFGTVLTVDIVKAPTLQSVGIGKVEMETLEEATRAARALHRSYLGGKLLLVFHATTGTRHRQEPASLRSAGQEQEIEVARP